MMLQTYFSNALTFCFLFAICVTCSSCGKETKKPDTANDSKQIAAMLDAFNEAAGKAEFEKYFAFYAEDGVFIGTDATENWNKKDFMVWAKPFFDKGKAWNFKSLERHIYFDETGNLAWFDELLDTQMKICRGSGVVVRQGNDWKVKQYVLSTTVPNAKVDEVTKMKASIEDSIILKLKAK